MRSNTTTLIRPAVKRSMNLIDRYAQSARDSVEAPVVVVANGPLSRRLAEARFGLRAS